MAPSPGLAATKRALTVTVLALMLVACGGGQSVEAQVMAWENDRNAEYGIHVTAVTCGGVDEHEKWRTYSCDLSYSNGTVATSCTVSFLDGDFLGIDTCSGGTYVPPWLPHSVARDEAAECLTAHGGMAVRPLVERVGYGFDKDRFAAQNASGGGIRAEFEFRPVTIAFAKSDTEAGKLERDWQTIMDTAGTSEDSIERHGRAIVHWWEKPTPKARATVAGCIESGQ
jgi:hypothetical protein